MSEDTFRMGADFEPQEAVVVGWPRLIEPVKGVFAEGTVHEIVRNLIGHVDKIIINCGWPGSAARCREILRRCRPQLALTARYLLDHETMDADTFARVFTQPEGEEFAAYQA